MVALLVVEPRIKVQFVGAFKVCFRASKIFRVRDTVQLFARQISVFPAKVKFFEQELLEIVLISVFPENSVTITYIWSVDCKSFTKFFRKIFQIFWVGCRMSKFCRSRYSAQFRLFSMLSDEHFAHENFGEGWNQFCYAKVCNEKVRKCV